ncbi:MAG: hypothetical protein WBO68_15695, partial [Pyrinomonadaceae bacterium]
MTRTTSKHFSLFLLIVLTLYVSITSTLAQGSWQSHAPIPETRLYAAVTSHGGLVYVFGGNVDGTAASTATPLVYDPVANTWSTRAADSVTRRCSARAVTLNGLIYVLGGWAGCDSNSPLNLTSIYNPATNSWSLGAPMPSSRGDAVAEAIDGKIYVTSGGNSYPGMN